MITRGEQPGANPSTPLSTGVPQRATRHSVPYLGLKAKAKVLAQYLSISMCMSDDGSFAFSWSVPDGFP